MEDVTLDDVTESMGCLTVIGPAASTAVSACTAVSAAALDALAEHAHLPADLPGGFVAASREFGLPAFDLFGPRETLDAWRRLLQERLTLATDPVLETARIEAGRPRYGVDMHEDTIPLEAGIEARAISFDKGCYVGQDVVIRILHRGQGRVARRLVWVEHAPLAQDGPAWEAGAPVNLGDRSVGHITSACWSPARRGLLGIALLHRDATEPGTVVRVGPLEAIVQKLP
jgi:folate-binding protein YgfZ